MTPDSMNKWVRWRQDHGLHNSVLHPCREANFQEDKAVSSKDHFRNGTTGPTA